MEILGGPLFAVAGAGESHGPAITTIVFGCPPGLELSRGLLQAYLDRRRPGSNRHGTPRREGDKVVILSGLYHPEHDLLLGDAQVSTTVDGEFAQAAGYETGFTTGEPIAALVLSTATRSADYAQFAGPQGEVRPGHTDLVKHYKSQGYVDVRGGGRSSYRSTISDVIGGSVARAFLAKQFGTVILSSICQVGPLRAERTLAAAAAEWARAYGEQPIPAEQTDAAIRDLEAAEIYSLDAEFASEAAQLIKQTRIEGDSLGAAVEVVAFNVPALVGEPLYQSLKVLGVLGG